MAQRDDNPTPDEAGPDPNDTAYKPPTYDYEYTDEDGQQVFSGHNVPGAPDGNLYTFRTGADVPNGFEYVPYTRTTTTPTPAPSPPPPGPSTGGFPVFTEKFTAPPAGDTTFTPPGYTPPPAFAAPSYTDATADPGYKFARDQGLGAISNSRAAQGLWGTGATGKALEGYATDLANTHYGDVFQRALSSYLTNYDTQFKQPYDYAYKSAYDTFSVNQRQNELNYDRAYTRYLDDYNRFRDERDARYRALHDSLSD